MEDGPTNSNLKVQWMSSNEAAERLGVTTATLYRFIDEGRLPAYRMGRVIRIFVSFNSRVTKYPL